MPSPNPRGLGSLSDADLTPDEYISIRHLRPNPKYGMNLDYEYDGIPPDEFENIEGYSRNLVLEERLDKAVRDVLQEVSPSNMKIRFPHTRGEFLPQAQYPLGIVGIDDDDESTYGWGFTFQTALDYIKLSKKYHESKINLFEYQCYNFPRDPRFCQHSNQLKGNLARINVLIPVMEARARQPPSSFDIIPQVFAEEDPSINSGLNGNEQESQGLQSSNVKITFTNSNIGMFSTSIPANDIGQLQIFSNESNEWRYTLIGSSMNQPLMTLNGLINKINSMIASVVTPQPPVTQPPVTQPPVTQPPIEEPPITTDHVPPPDMPVEVPMVTVTPTEPGQVNWIPEPFFSFINNVFRR